MPEEPRATIPLSDAEQLCIAARSGEIDRRQAWLQGYAEGSQYVIDTMIIRSRKLTGNWQISADGTEIVKVEP